METFSGTPSVDAPVVRKLAVSQLRRGGMHAKEKESAMMKNAYRNLNDSEGSAPAGETYR